MALVYSRRGFLAALAGAALAGPAAGGAPQSSLRPVPRSAGAGGAAAPSPERIIADARLGGQVSFTVAHAGTGAVLESHAGAVAVPPASVTKSVTALYALEALGPGHRFRTQVLATGGVANGVVQGDLVLVGGGDPTLDSDHLAALAAQLKASGVRELSGRFLVFDGALPHIDRIDPGQPDHVGYNPSISGIALNHNRVHFEWRRGANGYGVTMDARTGRLRPDVTVARMRVADRASPLYTYRAGENRDEWTVARAALGNGGARWLPVRLPGLYAGEVFATMARAQGIVLPAAVTSTRAPQGTVLAEHASAPLTEILRDMLYFSNNLTAEMVGLAATQARRGAPAGGLAASAAEMSRWARAGLGMADLRLVDHSGLGDRSRMTSAEMCAALVKVRRAGFRAMLREFPMPGSKRRVDRNHPAKVHAKTGTLNFVSALAGYVSGPDGTELAFAIFAADTAARAAIPKANREAPQGARPWNGRAKTMQQQLIERWSTVYRS